MTKPSICFVSPYIYPLLVPDSSIPIVGGAEVQQAFVIAGLKKLGYRITVLTNDFGQRDDSEIDGIKIRTIPRLQGGLPFVRFFHPGITRLVRCLEQIDADIYYQRGASWITGAVGWYASRNKKPFVYSVAHDLDTRQSETRKLFDFSMGWRGLWLYKFGVKRSRAVVVQNPQQACDGRVWLKQPLTLIKSCYMPPGNVIPGQCDGPVLWLATLRTWKRPELFLELARRLPDIRFVLAGGADQGEKGNALYRSIEEAASKLPNVRLTGFMPYEQADALFNGASLFVNTSDFEGFPNTFLQAWARGVPTVSFFDTGAADNQGRLGCIVSDLDAMIEAVERLHGQPEKWAKESQRCRAYFQSHHHVDSVVDQYDQLFMQLARARQAGPYGA